MGRATSIRLGVIERQIATEYGRDRVAMALYEVIHNGLEFGPRGMPTPEDREWIRGAIAMPIQEATQVALNELAWRLTQALDRAPDGLIGRFRESHRGVELGWE
jgi:hypothetical protein